MNSAFIALSSATSWGASDFLGGLSARRISPYQTVALAHGLSLAGLLALVLLLGLPVPGHAAAGLGLLAGLFGGTGLMLFYAALSSGTMGLTAAIAGVLTAAVPVVYGLATEGLPKWQQVAGFALAMIAIWAIAAEPAGSGPASRGGLVFGAIAGVCFGFYFVFLKLANPSGAGPGSVLWPVACSRVSSGSLAVVLCFAKSRESRNIWHGRTLLVAASVGLLDTGGNLLYLLAARLGRMDIAAVLSSLYPAVTILLAVWVLKERTSRRQALGMGLALGAVALIAQ